MEDCIGDRRCTGQALSPDKLTAAAIDRVSDDRDRWPDLDPCGEEYDGRLDFSDEADLSSEDRSLFSTDPEGSEPV